MSSVWRSEISFDGVNLTQPPASTYAGSSPFNTAAVGLAAHDGTDPNGQHSWGIRYGVRYHNYGITPVDEYQTFAECLHLATGINFAGEPFSSYGIIHTITATNGNAGAEFLLGGTIAIEKDEANDQIRFLTPIGNFTDTLSTYETPTEAARSMKPDVIAVFIYYGGDVADYNLDVQFFGFWGKENGVKFRGAPLSAAQAGPWIAWALEPLHGGVTVHSAFTQQTTREEAQLYWQIADGLSLAGTTAYSRFWNGGDTIPPLSLSVDLHLQKEHGVIYAGFSKLADNDTLFLQYSYDSGTNWSESVVAQGLGWVVDSITITSHGNELWAVWSDGQKIRQAFSTSWGLHWSAPQTIYTTISLPLRNLYPRLLVDPWHGLQYYFFIDNVGLKVLRDANFGLEPLDTSGGLPLPITVFTGITNVQVDANVFFDGTLEVRWNDGTVTQIMQSTNFGKTWTVYQTFTTTLVWSRHVVDWDLGLYEFIDFHGTDLQFHLSVDGGITFLVPGGGITVVAVPAIGPQFPDVEKLPDGELIIGYFDPTLGTLLYAFSRDLGLTWH